MALDNPVFSFDSRRFWRGSRVVELAVVVGLAVAVVAVAAQWGGSATEPDEQVASAVEATSPVPNAETVEVSVPVGTVAESQTSSATAVVEPSPRPVGAETQTGIVPGRPDPLDPATPDSFERYQVQRGESLSGIASARGIAVAELVRWNRHLREDSVLIRGEWLWIPAWDVPIVADESGTSDEDGKSGRGGG